MEKKEEAKEMGRKEKERERRNVTPGTMVQEYAKVWPQGRSARAR